MKWEDCSLTCCCCDGVETRPIPCFDLKLNRSCSSSTFPLRLPFESSSVFVPWTRGEKQVAMLMSIGSFLRLPRPSLTAADDVRDGYQAGRRRNDGAPYLVKCCHRLPLFIDFFASLQVVDSLPLTLCCVEWTWSAERVCVF